MKFKFGVLVFLLLAHLVTCERRDLRSVFSDIFNYRLPATHYAEKQNEESNNLPSEERKPFSVTEKEFTALRIEYIKNQILKKLRLKVKPVISMADRNKTKEYENFLPEQDDHMQSTYSEDFYGKTTQAMIFPNDDEIHCPKRVRYPSACLSFQMPRDIHTSDVSVAELWFHKEADNFDAHNQTFVFSEVAHWDSKRSFEKMKPIAIQETSLSEDWLKVDVTYVVKNWLEYSDSSDSSTHAINIACKTCGMDKSKSPVSFKQELKPFLRIYTHSQLRRTYHHRRTRRSLDCSVSRNECCRESLYVSFADVGWDDWIIKPKGYNAYFCKGSCSSPASPTQSGTEHNSIIQKLLFGENRNRYIRPELTLCCAATQYQPLQLVYMDNNKTLTTKRLSNMIVDSCGCM